MSSFVAFTWFSINSLIPSLLIFLISDNCLLYSPGMPLNVFGLGIGVSLTLDYLYAFEFLCWLIVFFLIFLTELISFKWMGFAQINCILKYISWLHIHIWFQIMKLKGVAVELALVLAGDLVTLLVVNTRSRRLNFRE